MEELLDLAVLVKDSAEQNETVTEATEKEVVNTDDGKANEDTQTEATKNQYTRYQNEVTLRGTIVKMSENKNRSVTVMTVATKATVTVSNYPTILFFGEAAKNASQFKEMQRVVIKGTLQSYDESKLRRGQSPVIIAGIDIKPESEVPLNNAEHYSADLQPIEAVYQLDKNRIDLRGQILAIECGRTDDIVITVRTVVNGHWAIIKYPYIARNRDYFLKNIYVRQFIRAIGVVQTANIPVEDEENEASRNAEIESGSSIRLENNRAKRIKTKKQQFFMLYDVYPVNR